MITTAKNKAKYSKFIAIELDQTQYWTEEATQYCDKIMTVYYYNASQHTYCCEITPSYWLTPVYSYPIFKKEIYDLPDKEFEKIEDKVKSILMQGDADNEGGYYHVHDINSVEDKHKKPLSGYDGRYYAPNGKKYRELEEDVMQYMRSNQPF